MYVNSFLLCTVFLFFVRRVFVLIINSPLERERERERRDFKTYREPNCYRNGEIGFYVMFVVQAVV